MRTCEEIRRENLERLITIFGTITGLADATDVAPGFLSHIRNKTKEMGQKTARGIENALKLERGWMDNPAEQISDAALFVGRAIDEGFHDLVMRQNVAQYLVEDLRRYKKITEAAAPPPEAIDPEISIRETQARFGIRDIHKRPAKFAKSTRGETS